MHAKRLTARLLAAVVLAALVGTPGAASAEDERPAPESTEAEEKKCVHGCERWGQRCNIDPRGVRKCRRVCERFGEICE